MKLLVLYRPQSEHRREVEEFVYNLKGGGLEGQLRVIDVDSKEGSSLAVLYDITSYPAILIIRDDGTLQQFWQGETLPLIDEVRAYL